MTRYLSCSALALFVVLTTLINAADIAAQAGDVQIAPQEPQAGDTIEVRYTPNLVLRDEVRLVLRGRIQVDPARPDPDVGRLAELTPDQEGTFRATFPLPDSAVYLVLGVEDLLGERIDTGGELWEVLVHGSDGRPWREALRAKIRDAGSRNSRVSVETARELAVLYPEELDSWLQLYYAERGVATGEEATRLQELHRAQLPGRLAAMESASSAPAEQMAVVIFYAGALGDTATARVWRERLLAEHPQHPFSLQQRVFALQHTHRGDPAGLLAAYEQLWEEIGEDATQLPFSAFQLAQRVRDPQAIWRWGERLEEADSTFLPLIARTAIQFPELREYGMDRVRRQLVALDQPQDKDRPLTQTRSQQRQSYQRATGIFLGELGSALLAEGRTEAALDTLESAVEATWNPSLFRKIAETRLAMGDAAAARQLFARVAADPEAPASFADSVAARLGEDFAASEWHLEVQSARVEMERAVWAFAVERTPSTATVQLLDGSGTRTTLTAAGQEPLVLAFWSRYCTPSRMQLDQLERTAADLAARGVRVVTVTDEAPTPEVQASSRRTDIRSPCCTTWIGKRSVPSETRERRHTWYWTPGAGSGSKAMTSARCSGRRLCWKRSRMSAPRPGSSSGIKYRRPPRANRFSSARVLLIVEHHPRQV